ncbi:type II toxin-antitoxin system HipA family toxin [Leptospira wolffii]|uniref:type II toxin-antitoxin system HipA family toxin n=1 Tax=Leptospira wolffii TaxID=409998 RepID=UPI0010835B77|nr:type II toxin-antitoxin system HipA family toxin [Leptospira wolffii]TGL44065.1 type II toxin-antitoxin system HipA family toxin [Leptospira wolffii]
MVNTAAHSKSLFVFMNGMRVGTLVKTAQGSLEFSYDRSWQENTELSRPISLSLPLTSGTYKGDKVINVFDNLLPEGVSVRQRLQAVFRTPSSEVFDLLTQIGSDCVGALQLLTSPELPENRTLTFTPLSLREIAERISQVRLYPLGIRPQESFRISIAGVQSKIALLKIGNEWQLPEGSTPTTHILKLQIGKIDTVDLSQSVENEYLCLRILRAFGLEVPNSEILDFEGQRVLSVTRFDREWKDNGNWIARLPQEDLCQAFGRSPNLKYENDGGPDIKSVLELLANSHNATRDRSDFMKAQILFFLMAATDGHAKNFSIFLRPMGRYELTPFYDVLSAFPYLTSNHPAEKLKMAMSLRGSTGTKHYVWNRISGRHFLSEAKHSGFSKKETSFLLDEIADSMESILQSVGNKLPKDFPPKIMESIFAGMHKARECLARTDAE